MSEKKIKAVRGNKERPDEVIKWLISNGATDAINQVTGRHDGSLYFVTPDGRADFLSLRFEYLFDVEELPHWRAKNGEEYWFIDDALDVRCTTEDYSRKHDDRYVAHNYFKTEWEAEEYCDKFIKLLEERR